MSQSASHAHRRIDQQVRTAERHLRQGELAAADVAATLALALDPAHPGAQLIFARIQRARGHWADARGSLQSLLAARPGDAAVRRELAGVLSDAQCRAEAIALLREPAPTDADTWFELGRILDLDGDADSALAAARSALALSPRHTGAQFLAARCLVALGDIEAAADTYRRLTQDAAHAARAWFALLDLKTVPLQDHELRRLEKLQANAPGDEDRLFATFALGSAYEQRQRPEAAFRCFEEANRRKRRTAPWNAQRFTALVDTIIDAFPTAAPRGGSQGENVVFLLGLPRSGSTLLERLLAGHPDVVAASELPDLPQVLAAESQRRGQPLPDWFGRASEADWLRLGAQYLKRTSRWQTRRVFTDKFPENWLYAPAIMRMLPGARLVRCQRDPLEALWSCYKQLFAPGMFHWSYDFAALAAYAGDCARLWRHVSELEPDRCFSHAYEALAADPATQLRRVLSFLGLPFDAACLDAGARPGQTRTASAAQVRQPLHAASRRADGYGELLRPLRQALVDRQVEN